MPHALAIILGLALCACANSPGARTSESGPAWSVSRGPASIEVRAPQALAERRDAIDRWIANGLRAIEAYYGEIPFESALLVLVPRAGRGFGDGSTSASDGIEIVIELGVDTRPEEFDSDWVLVHELVHVCSPSLPPAQHWLEEGLATYVEPLARLRAGELDAAEVWRAFATDMPQGLPEPGDRGLDFTPTWGRTYWGGAILCLLADVELRRRTELRFGLEDSLSAIAAAGGTIEQHWTIERWIAIGDRATGTTVLAETYARMRASPEPRELDGLWRELGVRLEGRRVVLDDAAPLAGVRLAITSPP